jgi:hypothetical protein
VPLLKGVPFVKDLSFLGAVRHGDYSSVGSTNSWNAGFEWSLVDDVKLRGTRSLSTRAPNINELYQAPSQDFPSGLNDPCLGVTATSTGPYAALCRANAGRGSEHRRQRFVHPEPVRPAGHQRLQPRQPEPAGGKRPFDHRRRSLDPAFDRSR